MTAPRERCSFEAVKAAVQTYYVAKTCCRSPRDTRRKNIPFTIRPDKRLLGIEMTQHQNSSSHALAASKRTQAVEVLGGKRLKPHQQTSRWLKPLATSLAFAFVTLSCPCKNPFRRTPHSRLLVARPRRKSQRHTDRETLSPSPLARCT